MSTPTELFDLHNCTVAVTGGTGVLGREIVRGLAERGARVALLSRNVAKAHQVIAALGETEGPCAAFSADVLDKASLEKAAEDIEKTYGRIYGLINGAGGNSPKATTTAQQSFFQLDEQAIRSVTDLNLLGTILPSQVFGRRMAQQKEGVILNISSLSALRPLTRVPVYSAAKAAVTNFTAWLAVHMAQEYSPNIRVNAIAPGFFLTEQNRFLLTENESGALTERGKRIIEHTPMGRFGQPEDLVGAVLWLLSPASKFVTGIVVPVDGGFAAMTI